MPDATLPTIPVPVCRQKPSREELRPGEVLCNHCGAKCCRYFALPIDKPKTWEDYDYIRWYLLHERASIFTDEGSWYLLVHNVCTHPIGAMKGGRGRRRPQPRPSAAIAGLGWFRLA